MLDPAELSSRPYFAASMANFLLFGISFSQTTYYFRTYPGDDSFLKALIAVLFIMEGVHLTFLTQATYDIYIVCKMPEKTESTALEFSLGTAVSITITLVITSAVQSFYAWRVYRLIVGHRWQKPLVASILTTSLAQLCTGLMANAIQYGYPPLSDMRKPLPRISYSISSVMTIICDLTISVSLVYFLNKMRTGFKSSQNVINRLVFFSMGNGILTSIVATWALIS
ncbi:hypothetical protein E4T56_gene9462, partial [Termitomyces sp. T112]